MRNFGNSQGQMKMAKVPEKNPIWCSLGGSRGLAGGQRPGEGFSNFG